MSKQTDSSLLIVSSVPALYQRIFSGLVSYEKIGSRVLKQIKTAYAFRQVSLVRELASVLLGLPLKEYRLIGQYYLVWCKCRDSQYQSDDLERIAEESESYRGKALISRGTFDVYQGNTESGFHFYAESLKANDSIADYIAASRGIAVGKSFEGFHASALKDLECLIPLLRYAEPMIYYDVLNSYAVELIEANRLEEAAQISLSVVSSPFATYYPEWRETHEDINERRVSRAKATFSAAPVPETTNLLHMPARSIDAPEPFTAQQRAAVLDMQAWKKKKMTNKDERPPKPVTSEEKQARLKELEKLGSREMLMQIMNALGDESVADNQLRKALAVLEGLDEG